MQPYKIFRPWTIQSSCQNNETNKMNCFSVNNQEIHEPFPNASNTWPRRQKISSAEYYNQQPAPIPETNNYCHRNPWGSLSYADLITQAIESSPTKRLTLAEIYLWMTTQIPYFRDRAEGPTSLGWKNSIRHNLSLHNKFIKIQNEEKGKSSWWMINANPTATRRRTSSTSSTSSSKKKKGALRKTVDCLKKLIPGKKTQPKVPPPTDNSTFNTLDNQVYEGFRPRSYSNVVYPLDTIREVPIQQQSYYPQGNQQPQMFNGNYGHMQATQFQVTSQPVYYNEQQYNTHYQNDMQQYVPRVSPISPVSTSNEPNQQFLTGTSVQTDDIDDLDEIIRFHLEGSLNFT